MLMRVTILSIFRVPVQIIVTPLISAALFVFIFGNVVGNRIANIGGVPYISFVLPGILMMNIVTAAFLHSSSGLYFQRFIRNIEEMLVAPISYMEIMTSYLIGGLTRAAIIGAGVLAIALPFGGLSLMHPFAFLFYVVAAATIFGLLGLIIGLWANDFEQLTALNTFVIMPFSFLGGMFYTTDMLPPIMRMIASWNPLYYFIDGMRYAMVGIHESSLSFGVGFMLVLILILGTIVHRLFSTGWRLRE